MKAFNKITPRWLRAFLLVALLLSAVGLPAQRPVLAAGMNRVPSFAPGRAHTVNPCIMIPSDGGMVTRPALRIFTNSSSSAGYEVRGVADASCGELSINSSNAPQLVIETTP